MTTILKRFALASCLTAGICATAAQAETPKAICAALADPMQNASNGMSKLSVSLTALDVTRILPQLSDPERAEFAELERRRQALLPHLNAFLTQLEDTALQTRRCAR